MPVANEPNLSGNLTGGQGGDNLTAKATSAVKTMETSTQRLVSQLRVAKQLMADMVRQSDQIAKNLAKISGGMTGPNLASTGGATGASQAVQQASQQSQKAQQAMGSMGGSTAGAMGGRFAGGMATVGSGVGMAVGIGANYLLSQSNGLFGASWKGFAGTDAAMASLAPGRFRGVGAATNYLASGVAAGQTANDSIGMGAALAGIGMTPGTREFGMYKSQAQILSRATGQSLDQVGAGLASFQNPGFVNFQRARGIFARDPKTGAMASPMALADAQLKTQFTARSGSMSKFYGMSQDRRLQAMQESLKPGGGLAVGLANSGLDAAGQDQMRTMWQMSAYAGKPISSMGTDERTKVAAAIGAPYFTADAKKSQAAAQAQSTALGSTQSGYSAVRGVETDMINALNANTTALKAIGGALGANSALGHGGGTSAVTGIVASFLGNKIANRVGNAAESTGKLATRFGSRAAAAAEEAASIGSRAGKLLGGAAIPLMAIDTFLHRDMVSKYADATQHIGVGQKIKDSIFHPMASAFGSGMRNMTELGQYFTGKRDWWSGKTVGTEVGTRGAPDSGGKTSATSTDSTGLLAEAMKWLGTPYSWGGGSFSGPSRGSGKGAGTIGFDCSGFVRYVFGKYGVSLPRTSQAMASSGNEVSRNDARKGDILIITWNEPNGHVAIYLGDGKMIHAPKTGDVVKVANVPWGNVSHIRRVIGGAAVGSATVGKSTSTSVAQGALPFGVGRLWEGASFFNPNTTTNALSPTAESGSGTGLSISSAGGNNGKAVFNALRGMGFTKGAAAGVVGNLQQESNVDPTSRQHGGGPGRGIMQWSVNERWAQLTKWAKASKQDPNALGTQVSWMVKEMKNSGVFSKLAGTDDVHAATMLFEQTMEKAGTPNMAARYGYADSAYKSYSEGSWRVSKDQLAKIHQGEMILPNSVAETVRTSVREGLSGQRSGGGGNTNVTIIAQFAAGTPQQQARDLLDTFKTLVEQNHTAVKARGR